MATIHLVGSLVWSPPALRIANFGLSCPKPSSGGRSHAVTNLTSLARWSLSNDSTTSQNARIVGVFSSSAKPL
jgi:hypothetical protein